jgi:hypothetical protein
LPLVRTLLVLILVSFCEDHIQLFEISQTAAV